MNNNVLKYKGYSTVIEYSAEDQVLHGKIEGIDDLVNFSSENASEIEKEFQNAVDEYLELCKEIGKEPSKVYSGTFNVRIKPELHRKIAIEANHNRRSLNAEVENAIDSYLRQNELNMTHELKITLQQSTQPTQGLIGTTVDGWKGEMYNGFALQGTSTLVNTVN